MSENQETSGGHAHEKPHYDDVNAPVLFVLAIISAIVTFAIVAAVQGFYHQMRNAKFYDNAYKTMGSKFVAAEQQVLTEGSEERGITKIEDAMKKAVSAAGGKWERPVTHTHNGSTHSHEAKEKGHSEKSGKEEKHGEENSNGKDEHGKKTEVKKH